METPASREKVKVVFAINDFLIGGAQRLHLDLFNALDLSRFELHLVTMFQFPEKKDFFDLVPAHVHVHKMNFKNSRDLKEWMRLYTVFTKIAPHVVISSLFFTNTVCRIVKLFLGYRVIAIEHNTYIHKTKFEIFIDRLLSHVSFKIIAVSETVASFTSRQENIPRTKFVVIHNGIDIKKIKHEIEKNHDLSEIRKALSAQPGDKFVINVGRLTAQKNHQLMIEAFEIFSKKHPGYRLIVMGDGSLRPSLVAEIKKRGIEHIVSLAGATPQIIPYYLVSDMFVSTSVIEGFGIAHAEALVCGLPVVTTKTAGPDEMIVEGVNGYFVEYTPESVVAGMEKIITNNIRSQHDAITQSVAKFSITEIARTYERLILSAAKNI